MPSTLNTFPKLRFFQKIVGITTITTGLLIWITGNAGGAVMPLLLGLFILFGSTAKVEDERSVSLRSSSIYFALILGFTFKLLSSYLYKQQWISFEMTEINHFLILTLLMANIIYYVRMYLIK